MHHYPFHVGDYIRATAHLDVVEDCIYRRLIDLYMETELPIPNETQQVIRRLRLGSSGLILETILREFFTLEGDNCWHNSRCDQEILEYKRLAGISRINGKLGGRPKKTQRVISNNPAGTQQEPGGLQPRTTNHEPITNNKTLTHPLDAMSPPAEKPPKGDSIPYQKIVDLYHKILPSLPKIAQLTSKRKGYISARWRSGNLPDLENWEEYFDFVSKSDFLMGMTDPVNGHKRFIANLEWLSNESNYTKVLEGKYHGKK